MASVAVEVAREPVPAGRSRFRRTARGRLRSRNKYTPRSTRQARGEGELGRCRVRSDARRREEIVEAEHAVAGRAFEQPVQQVCGGVGVGVRAVRGHRRGVEVIGEGAQPQVWELVAHEAPRERERVDSEIRRGADIRARLRAASRKPQSKRTLWPTITVPCRNSSNDGSSSSIGGAGNTIASVIPVSNVISGGIGTPGFTSVSTCPSSSPPRSLSAPISVMRS